MNQSQGPSPEALESIGWSRVAGDERVRIARIAEEVERGFRALHDVEPAVAFFGSARSAETAREYSAAREVSRALAEVTPDAAACGMPRPATLARTEGCFG